MDTPIYPIGAQETTTNTPNSLGTSHHNNSILRTVSSDVDQVVQQANSLCDNMAHYKPYLLSASTTSQHDDELRPWMDSMIGKANEVLNALLRLRKQQMVSAPSPPSLTKSTASTDHQYQQQNSFTYHPPPNSLPSPPSSSRITITKRDWPNLATQQHHDPTSMANSRTSIPSRQRKRGVSYTKVYLLTLELLTHLSRFRSDPISKVDATLVTFQKHQNGDADLMEQGLFVMLVVYVSRTLLIDSRSSYIY